MARIRTIKPDFFTSEDIVMLSPLARLLYIATWCEADKEGRMVWKPNTFKLRYLPGDACDVAALADELVQAGLVVLYGDGLAYIPKFTTHQHLNPRESASVLPDPCATPTRPPRGCTRQPRVNHASSPVSDVLPQVADASARVPHAQGGREGKGRECNTPLPPKGDGSVHAFPPGFERFWEAYPRKVGKDAAAKAFAKRKPDEGLIASMLKAIAAQRSSPAWTKDGGQFIPHPSTWLNEGRWMDESVGTAPQASQAWAGAL